MELEPTQTYLCTSNPTSRDSSDHMCVCVCQELQSEGAFKDVEVVIAGLSNVYTHYITTFEEYQVHAAMIYQSVIHSNANSTT